MRANSEAVWNNEYSAARAIPSSIRTAPSQALLLFTELLNLRHLARALDVGCGNGRNALYLAQLGLRVDAMDFSRVAVEEAAARVEKAEVGDRVKLKQARVEERFPFDSSVFDLCLDFYVFCHLLDQDIRDHYVRELMRVTRTGGHVISTAMSVEDEYYADLLEGGGRQRQTNCVTDPANGVVKHLYTGKTFREAFVPPFQLRYFVELEFSDVVLGRPYNRQILVMALRKL